MPLANAAPSATRKPISSSVAGSGFTNPMANVDAMSRFEGPANGIRLNPKPPRKISANSIIEVIRAARLSLLQKLARLRLISASI